MGRSYASQFRAMVVEQVRSGRRVVDGLPDGDISDRFVSDQGVTKVSLEATETDGNGTVRDLPKSAK